MKKVIYYFLSVFIGTTLYSCSLFSKGNYVCFQKQCFEVEVVSNREDRQKGLQFRRSLGDKKGMLFVFEESQRYRFWMKHTLIPLDIIWINSSQKVVDIRENVPPCYDVSCPTYEPQDKALYVLELNAGKSHEMHLTVGKQLRFELNDYNAEEEI